MICFLKVAIKMKISSDPVRPKCLCLKHPYCFLTGSWFTWSMCCGSLVAAQYKTKMYHIHNKNGALLRVERGGHNLALTTNLRPMNFAQICFSPTDFLNGKSMEARDGTSLKDNVSKCQLLGFRSSPPEFAMSAICTGVYGIKRKDSLAGVPSWLKESSLLLALLLLRILLGSLQAQPFRPCWLFEGKSPANYAEWQGGSAHLASFWSCAQTNKKPKTAEMHASCCLLKGSLKLRLSWALSIYTIPLRAHGEGRTPLSKKTKPALQSWLIVIKRHLLIIYTYPSFQEHSSDCQDL